MIEISPEQECWSHNTFLPCLSSLKMGDRGSYAPAGGKDLSLFTQAAIRKELNEFKSCEMEVHEESKQFTR